MSACCHDFPNCQHVRAARVQASVEQSLQSDRCYICDGPPYKVDNLGRVICSVHAGVHKLEPRKVVAMPARNSPCPCGSGKKFKQCCLNKSINAPI